MTTLLDIGTGRVATVATFFKTSELLGSGRYSEVYKAFDTHSHADVALKLYVGFDGKSHAIAREEEAVLNRLGQINSEYFPKLRRGAKHRINNQNHPVLVLELGVYIGSDGQKRSVSLKDVIPPADGPEPANSAFHEFWSAESLARWIIHLVQAVKQLHTTGIVHRDIKPANILLKRGAGQSEGVPLFLDFNSAIGSGDSASGTGTLQYLPPEVTAGKRQAPRREDDLWAIAKVAWEIIHGLGSSPEQSAHPHSLIRGPLPENLIVVLRRALNLNPRLDLSTPRRCFKLSREPARRNPKQR